MSARSPAGRVSGVGPNVYFLGLTSLLTDVSSEMVASVLPIYMAFALLLTPLQLGFVDGLYHGAAAVARLGGGLLADRWHRNREVAAAGYGLSALCKLGLLWAGGAWGLLAAVIALDRVGKGVRTPPRDALISLSAPPRRLGLAFGIHRAFDTAGALAGPLVAFAILAALPEAYDAVFVVSFFIAVAGLAALLIFVVNVGGAAPAGRSDQPSLSAALGLLRRGPFRALVTSGAALGLVTVGDSFIYLFVQRRTSLPAGLFPLLSVVTAGSYLLLAIPAGRLADRIGRGRVFGLGNACSLAACLCLLLLGAGVASGLLALMLLGASYACTDGVLMAAAGGLLPERQRASGLAVLATASGLSRLAASVLFGALWQSWSIESALAVFATALAVVLALTSPLWLRLEEGR